MPEITLKKISHEALEEILQVEIPTVNLPAGSQTEPVLLSYAPEWDYSSQTFGIYVEGELVGVYCMTSTTETDSLWLGGYLLEHHYRAHGYGQTTLLEILKKISQDHPYCNSINLTIEPENVVARRLCQKKPR